MENLKDTIQLHCTFCHSVKFAMPYEGYIPYGGSFVVCANCGRENDVTSLLIIAKSKGFEIAKNHARKLVEEMKKELNKSFRNSKYIRIK
ncbi:hypothetical protein [Pectobacterium aroidearum]|uniref:hypothetical protein n=1 Tax=Pectobacterium aroidearum TaxID=1201031 RepID=UPI0015DFD1F3|nr:hypothetical protein [Pectobacterium aroidearum]MBA0205762.1 hypothetical protein [Pectobacterium aroidearum]